jgi:hypothetical protein
LLFLCLSAFTDTASLERNGKRDAHVHDPSNIVKWGNEYRFFATGPGLNSWRSKDLNHWERGPRVFPTVPRWITNVVADHRGYFWAPDGYSSRRQIPRLLFGLEVWERAAMCRYQTRQTEQESTCAPK